MDAEGAEEAVLRGVQELRWRYLALETSVSRSGGLSLERAGALVEELLGGTTTSRVG